MKAQVVSHEQTALFESIKLLNPSKGKLAEVIGTLLGVKPDAAYRRIRGETPLSLRELGLICDAFNLSMDEFLNRKMKQNVLFRFHSISNETGYINDVLRFSDELHSVRLADEKEIVFVAHDIPFYHFYKFPELAIFRIYAWHQAQKCNVEPFSRFCSSSDNTAIMAAYEKILLDYTHIPTTEVWTTQTADTTLRLLEYYIDIGAFDERDTALQLVDQLVSLMEMVKRYTSDGYMENVYKTPFLLYACSVNVENNLMLFRKGADWKCSMKLYAINRMMTSSQMLCSETRQWTESLKSKSVLISGNTALKERLQFFGTINTNIQRVMTKINTNEF
jgi:hypothetical protein